MAKAIFTTLVLLCNSIAASAQPSGNYGYVFGGPVVVLVPCPAERDRRYAVCLRSLSFPMVCFGQPTGVRGFETESNRSAELR
ncbi:MAG: hypothetical protein LAO04_09965 [Acidobacteriia bacterium]|nr:hypothetical protein [Terriglobia bacterium]